MASTYRQYFDDISPQDKFIFPTFYRYSYEVREEYDTDDPDFIFGYTLFIKPDRAPLLPKDLEKNVQFLGKSLESLPVLEIEFNSNAGPPEEIIKLVKTYLQGGYNLSNLSTGNNNPNGFTYPKPGTPFPGSSPGSEHINTTHDKDYDYKKVVQEDGTVVYFFIGRRNKPKERFPNWTEAVDDGSYGTIRRNAIIERVKFDSPPNPTSPETSQTSRIIENSEDPNANSLYGNVIDEKTNDPIKGANLTYGSLSAVTDDKGYFIIELPSPKPIDPINPPPEIPDECINTTHDNAYNYKRLTYSDGRIDYYFIGKTGTYKRDFPNWTEAPPNTLVGKTSGTINRDAIVERVKFKCPPATFPPSSSLDGDIGTSTNVTSSRLDLEVSAVDYETKTIPVTKADNTLKNNLGFIPLKTIKADLDKEIIESVTPKEEDIEDSTKAKKDFRWHLNQKLIDLLNKLKTILLPIILTMVAKFGVTKVQELADNAKGKICPPKKEIDKIIKRKNKFVKQINNSLKIIDKTLKILGISRSFIDIALTASKAITASQLATPTATPGLTVAAINKPDDTKKDIEDIADITKKSIDGTIIILNLLRTTLTQIVTYLNLLDRLIQDCYPNAEQEQLSAELLALTQEQANQESPVVTIVNGFTMGVETENTTNSLKRRRAIATNAGGVVMLKGEWSFSSIDQILIDELVFYIQINDLKAD